MPAPPPLPHRIVAANVHRVPAPFRSFAVRSDEARHATQARAPYGRVHLVQATFLDARALAGLSAAGRARLPAATFPEIDHARAAPDALAAAAGLPDLAGPIAAALRATGVLGTSAAVYRRHVMRRIDFLAASGSGFHNDVRGPFSRCLFWLLAIDLADVEFVMPHAGVRVGLAPGDLLVFDPTLAHGLCRPADAGCAVGASFASGANDQQLFLTGELRLGDSQWAALGSPWLPVAEHEQRGALDLRVASFDDRSGAVQRLRTLRDGMKGSTGAGTAAPP